MARMESVGQNEGQNVEQRGEDCQAVDRLVKLCPSQPGFFRMLFGSISYLDLLDIAVLLVEPGRERSSFSK